MKRLRYAGALLLIGLLLLLTQGCAKQPRYRQAAGYCWGTTYHITYKSSEDLTDAVLQAIADIDNSLSAFNTGSVVSKINANESMRADAMFAEVFSLSQRVSRESGGAFDPTVAPLINLWGFGYAEGEDEPDSLAINEALRSVGILDCGISADGIVEKKSPQTEFNFSAIAKGFGVDHVAETLRQRGCDDYMVEIGGEIALAGKSPHGCDWKIQIDAPDLDLTGEVSHNRLEMLTLTDCCIATSGNYRNFKVTSDGVVGHTISPVTGRPVMSKTLSATIIADNCAYADALATASMALDLEQAEAMLRRLGVKAILVVADGGNKTKIVRIGF